MNRNRFAGRARFSRGSAWLLVGYLLLCACPMASAGGRGRRAKEPPKDHHAGRELFVKVWEPGKRSPSGGDGLGPLYNETSCVACHRLGGVGGAGGIPQNVTLLIAEANLTGALRGGETYRGELEDLHRGFRNITGIVLHRHSTNPAEEKRLREIEAIGSVDTHDRLFTLRTSARNTPPVFGAGSIDEVAEEVLLAAEGRRFEGFPEVQGRVSWLTDGRIGRFGWKGQTATLRDFVTAACANELGLEVPGHHQACLEAPKESDPSADGPDMDQQQCDELVAFVSGLAPPRLRPILADRARPWGYSVFEQIGCAACHTPQLGALNGIYSDLLLHDMGESLSDAATYYGAPSPSGGPENLVDARERAREARAPAIASEWRTPPLWGIADSAPYLHDGRAATLEHAIQFHGGEAAKSVRRYRKLSRAERIDLLNFLRSRTVAAKGRRGAAIEAIQARSREHASPDPDVTHGQTRAMSPSTIARPLSGR